MKEKDFKFSVAGKDHKVRYGNCMVTLYRQQQEMDNLMVEYEPGETVRIFNNEDLCRWMAGFCIQQVTKTHYLFPHMEMNGKTFRELYGWNSPTALLEKPSDEIVEAWIDVETRNIDAELIDLDG